MSACSAGDSSFSLLVVCLGMGASQVALLVKKPPACRGQNGFRFNPLIRKIPWRRAWQPTPVFLPGESSWTEEPGGLKSIGLQRVDTTEATEHTCIHA